MENEQGLGGEKKEQGDENEVHALSVVHRSSMAKFIDKAIKSVVQQDQCYINVAVVQPPRSLYNEDEISHITAATSKEEGIFSYAAGSNIPGMRFQAMKRGNERKETDCSF
ncbi:hypothetical protein KQX54_017021 [Cotesia glomerata]|uniref:Uncharacterized protein n=1 Tax=Cotesia glomerata TaxID=32391 RepID=A0AAV7I8G0_COTGL|nr:hypothetical protein KQX54_017021 [Cotesia glomerata]